MIKRMEGIGCIFNSCRLEFLPSPSHHARKLSAQPPHKATPPILRRLRIQDGQGAGVIIFGKFTKGRLEGCDIAGNKLFGVEIGEGADPFVVACK